MKNIVFSIVFLLFLSCSKDKVDPTWGVINATKNSQPWGGKPLCLTNKPHNQDLNINVTIYNEKGYERESLTFIKIPDAVGTYLLKNTNAQVLDSLHGLFYNTSLDHGDVFGDYYELLEGTIENRITVSKKDGDELWGEFQATLVKNSTLGENDPAAPDTILFDKGSFHIKIHR